MATNNTNDRLPIDMPARFEITVDTVARLGSVGPIVATGKADALYFAARVWPGEVNYVDFFDSEGLVIWLALANYSGVGRKPAEWDEPLYRSDLVQEVAGAAIEAFLGLDL